MRDQFDTKDFRDALDAIWQLADVTACPVLCHGFLTPEVARSYPRAKFIAAHACGSRQHAEQFRGQPNVYYDTAASTLGRNSVEYFVEHFGVEKILYGSDLPYANPACRIGQVIGGRLDDKTLDKILGGNMAGLLGIGKEN